MTHQWNSTSPNTCTAGEALPSAPVSLKSSSFSDVILSCEEDYHLFTLLRTVLTILIQVSQIQHSHLLELAVSCPQI
jgi:hypothetical protein